MYILSHDFYYLQLLVMMLISLVLMNDLFKNYHNDVRPICGDGDPVTVKVGLALRQVIDLVSICGDDIYMNQSTQLW